MTKKILIPALLAILLTGGIIGAKAVQADDTSNTFSQRIAEKFGLNQEEVSDFMRETREQKRAQMQENKEERLNQAVDDGVITAEQKEALTNKFAENQQEREQHKEEMQAWMEQQGIDHDALRQYGGFRKGGFGKGCLAQ